MAVVLIPVIFRGPTHGEAKVDTKMHTIGACFDAVEERFPGLRELVIDPESGGIHRFVQVTLNGEMLERTPEILDTPVSATDEIEVIAAIAGG
jgi:molybdopterin converting factor small subunit